MNILNIGEMKHRETTHIANSFAIQNYTCRRTVPYN